MYIKLEFVYCVRHLYYFFPVVQTEWRALLWNNRQSSEDDTSFLNPSPMHRELNSIVNTLLLQLFPDTETVDSGADDLSLDTDHEATVRDDQTELCAGEKVNMDGVSHDGNNKSISTVQSNTCSVDTPTEFKLEKQDTEQHVRGVTEMIFN